MADVGLEVDKTVAQAVSDVEPKKVMRTYLKVAALAMKSDVQQNFNLASSPTLQRWADLKYPRVFGGNKPLNNFGLLKASFTTGPNHISRETETSVTIGSNRPGANLMHFGGTVVPVNAKALTIPVTKEAARVKGARQFPRPLFLMWKKWEATGVLAEKNGGGGIIVHYILTRMTKHTARPIVGFGDRLIKRLQAGWQRVAKALFKTGQPPTGGA